MSINLHPFPTCTLFTRRPSPGLLSAAVGASQQLAGPARGLFPLLLLPLSFCAGHTKVLYFRTPIRKYIRLDPHKPPFPITSQCYRHPHAPYAHSQRPERATLGKKLWRHGRLARWSVAAEACGPVSPVPALPLGSRFESMASIF